MKVHSIKMPIGNGGGIPNKGRPLQTAVHLKHSIIEVKAENNCLARVLVIAVAKLTNDPDYKAYRKERKMRSVASRLFTRTGIDRSNGGVPE
jgi:hypothetical protein